MLSLLLKRASTPTPTDSHGCPYPKDYKDLLLKPEKIVGPFTFQNIISIVACVCVGITLSLSLWLIIKHLHRYTCPREQRQIIRIIFTPVVFSVFSLLSILFYSASVYMTPLRDLYECFAVAAIFLLFVEYVTPGYSQADRDAFFAQLSPPKPTSIKIPFLNRRSNRASASSTSNGLAFYKRVEIYVFAYLIVWVLCTILQLLSTATGHYCETSYKPKFAHLWVQLFENVAVSVAVTGVVNMYRRLSPLTEFKSHKPMLKLVSLKLIVFVNFLQTIIFNVLIQQNAVHGSRKFTGKDFAIGVPAIMVSVEQVIFAIFFHYSFRSREYHEDNKIESGLTRMRTLRAAAHAFNPWDLLSGMARVIPNIVKLVSSSRKGGAATSSGGKYEYIGANGMQMQGSSPYEPFGRNSQTYASGDVNPTESEQGAGLLSAERYERMRSSSQPPIYQPPLSSPYEGRGERGRGGGGHHGRSDSRDSRLSMTNEEVQRRDMV